MSHSVRDDEATASTQRAAPRAENRLEMAKRLHAAILSCTNGNWDAVKRLVDMYTGLEGYDSGSILSGVLRCEISNETSKLNCIREVCNRMEFKTIQELFLDKLDGVQQNQLFNTKATDGLTMFHYVVYAGRQSLVEDLLKNNLAGIGQKVLPDTKGLEAKGTIEGDNAFHIAARMKRSKTFFDMLIHLNDLESPKEYLFRQKNVARQDPLSIIIMKVISICQHPHNVLTPFIPVQLHDCYTADKCGKTLLEWFKIFQDGDLAVIDVCQNIINENGSLNGLKLAFLIMENEEPEED